MNIWVECLQTHTHQHPDTLHKNTSATHSNSDHHHSEAWSTRRHRRVAAKTRRGLNGDICDLLCSVRLRREQQLRAVSAQIGIVDANSKIPSLGDLQSASVR